MLSRRTARDPHDTPSSSRGQRRSRLGRTLPALVLGVTALALAVPTTLPATASPGGPATGATHEKASSKAGTASTSTAAKRSSGQHLTAAAQQAGLEVGNATMGWRERGTERTSVREQGRGLLRYGAASRSSTSSFTPDGVLGIDISSYQRTLKWSTWTKKDRDFAYIKATEGTSYKNPYFTSQYSGAKKAGVIRGAYHFANPAGAAGYKQARYFVKNGGGWSADGKTLPGVLDIEYNPYGSTCYGVSKKNTVKWVSSFTAEYKKLTGKAAVIYSTTDWWTRCTGNSSKFATTNPLWIARYGSKKPGTLPKGWKTATFWQYTSNPIDQDVFPGKAKALKTLATAKD
jgi:GH25 family lysozyme M1 (1,4-beta-N-acetylmuramidase)